jgi:hypothetical protein
VKLGKLGTTQRVFKAADTYLSYYSTTGTLYTNLRGASTNYFISYANVYRDPSAWYHIVLAVDTTQSTAADRQKLYVNGVQVTASGPLGQTYPPQNDDTGVNSTSNQHQIAGDTVDSLYFDGYLADIHFIDGQALDPTSFGEFSATTGVWMPKAYTGSYGTNGFHLEFADNSSNTATTLGKDTSGNGNNWTPNNLSVTAGAGNDSLVDVPTNGSEVDTGAGGQVRGNYCTWNPLEKGANATLANGNLDASFSAASLTSSTIGLSSGKWYWEVTVTATNPMIGIIKQGANLASYPGSDSSGWGYSTADGYKYNAGSGSAYGATATTNDVIGVAFDADNGTLTYYKNNTSQGTAFTGLTSGPYFPAVGRANGTPSVAVNFGQRSWAYQAPSGFKALNTSSLPAPVVTKPSDLFDVKLYTGNGSTQTISGLGFSPDLVWLKKRSGSEWHSLYDTIRGVEAYISTNTTNAEATANNTLTAFSSTGFTVGSQGLVNENGFTYAAWAWDAGSSTVTNTAGSISSQVRANASAGFSIVTATKSSGSSTAQTFGHGLGVEPHMIILKRRNGSESWYVYNKVLGNAARLQLNETSAVTNGSGVWGSTTPTSQVFTVQSFNDGDFVAYCFAPVVGYSSMGSYVGNFSTDGPFVHTGFRPRFVLTKASSAGGNWQIIDSARSDYNLADDKLWPSQSYQENDSGLGGAGADNIDILSNGFKLKNANNGTNGSGVTYIYFAVAESPFQYARAR